MQRTCPVCGEKGHLAQKHFVPLYEEREKTKREGIKKEVGLSPAGHKRSQCSICGSTDHNRLRHGRPPKKLTGTLHDHRCSICGKSNHNAIWHRQEDEKNLMEKKCKACGNVLPIDNFRKTAQVHKDGGDVYVHYNLTCKKCSYTKNHQKYLDKISKFELGDYLSQIAGDGYFTTGTTSTEQTNIHDRLVSTLLGAKRRASNKKINFDLDLDFMVKLYSQQNGKCFYSGLPMTTSSGPMTISIDRIDSTLGYIKSNVVLCGVRVNYLKNSTDVDDFINLCGAIWKHSHKEDQPPKE